MQHPKMKFVATMDGAKHTVECQRDEKNTDLFHMVLDDKPFDVDELRSAVFNAPSRS